MLRPLLTRMILVILSMMALVSCGGGGSSTVAGIGGTGITASGSVTGFGSIYVNGVHYDIAGATIHVNGVSATESDLRLGMVVTVKGTVNSNGVDGTATSVDYRNEIQGPIDSSITMGADGLSQTFTVLGLTVQVNQTSTSFEGFSFDTIAPSDVVEVSGFIDASGQLVATHIKKEGTTSTTDQVELKGTVANFNGTNQFTVTIDGKTYNVQFSSVSISITNGLLVRIKGSLTGTTISTTDIERVDSVFSSNQDKASLEGIISNLNTTAKTFTIGGQQVDYSGATVPSGLTLADGVRVEVEGPIVNNVLVVSEFEGRDGDLKISSIVQSVDAVNNTIVMQFHPGQTVSVKVDINTSMEDETKVVSRMKITDINPSDYLEIELRDKSGVITATSIHRKTLQSSTRFRIEGPVTAVNKTSGSESVTVLGVTFTTDNNTLFQISDVTTSRINFFNTIATGHSLLVKDDQISGVSDGVAVEMDLKN